MFCEFLIKPKYVQLILLPYMVFLMIVEKWAGLDISVGLGLGDEKWLLGWEGIINKWWSRFGGEAFAQNSAFFSRDEPLCPIP